MQDDRGEVVQFRRVGPVLVLDVMLRRLREEAAIFSGRLWAERLGGAAKGEEVSSGKSIVASLGVLDRRNPSSQKYKRPHFP